MIERVEQVLQRINQIEANFNQSPVLKNVQNIRSFEEMLAGTQQKIEKESATAKVAVEKNAVPDKMSAALQEAKGVAADKSAGKENHGVAADISAMIQESAARHGVDAALVDAIAKNESAYQPDAVSQAGAVGVMQLMPATADGLGVKNIYDPYDNIDGGTRYLKELLDTFDGDITKTVAAYNAGPQAVKAYGGVPPYAETQSYVKNVLADYK